MATLVESSTSGSSGTSGMSSDISDLEWSVFETTNQLRTNPAYFIEILSERLQYFDGDIYYAPGSNIGIRTFEGPAAVEEAIAYLETARPTHPLEWRTGMAMACTDHVYDTGPLGLTGHTGSDGSKFTDRLNRYGQWGLSAAENISYGQQTGLDVVM